MTINSYFWNLILAIKKLFMAVIYLITAVFGVKVKEGFEEIEGYKPYISGYFLLSSILLFTFIVFYGYGAANLSYCYNKRLGRSDSESFMWAVLAYIFNGVYYPYYGVFLNPLCSMIKTGGRR